MGRSITFHAVLVSVFASIGFLTPNAHASSCHRSRHHSAAPCVTTVHSSVPPNCARTPVVPVRTNYAGNTCARITSGNIGTVAARDASALKSPNDKRTTTERRDDSDNDAGGAATGGTGDGSGAGSGGSEN